MLAALLGRLALKLEGEVAPKCCDVAAALRESRPF